MAKNIYQKLILIIVLMVFTPSMACTIFVLTDGNNTYFFNNEDYSNPNTRVWFRPGGENHYGAVYFGFDNGFGQGGVNTEGLAYDWFAGGNVPYRLSNDLKVAKQNPCERLLESCANVDEAIEFFKTYAEPGFASATILIADKTGASVIIGARNGELYFEKSNKNVAIGYGLKTFQNLNGREALANFTNGTEILHQCEQKGEFATKYSSIYNLKTGAVSVYQFHSDSDSVDFNLTEELEKGGHYYDLPQIRTQLSEPLKPLLLNQRRLPLYDFEDLSGAAPEITTRVKKLIKNSKSGSLNPENYSKEFWKTIEPYIDNIQIDMNKFGKFISVHLTGKEKQGDLTTYDYVIIYENARILMGLQFGADLKLYNVKNYITDITNTDTLNTFLVEQFVAPFLGHR